MKFFVLLTNTIFLVTLPIIAGTPLMGKSECTIRQMRAFLKAKNPTIDKKYLALPQIYLEEGKKEGIRGDLAFAQSLWETNFFRFGGDVHSHQNNFAGLGAVGHKNKGLTFPSPRLGIRAQIQHLKAYAVPNAKLKNPCVDPRFKKVKKHTSTLEGLSGKWAVPGYDTKKYRNLKIAKRRHDSYGHKILNIYNQMRHYKTDPISNCKK